MDTSISKSSAVDPDIPLVVDLDGTVILTDTLQESLVRLFFRNPFTAIASIAGLARGRAAFKRQLAAHSLLRGRALPQRRDLIELLRVEKTRNRKIHLVTAADQDIADEVAFAIGLFDSATGSDGKNNLKGVRKLAWLKESLPGEFLYAGDSAADLPIFLGASGAILCDVAKPTANAVEQAGIPILARLTRERHPFRGFLAAMRSHHWSKNFLIFLPLFLGHAYSDAGNILKSVAAFFILCALASGTYFINDLADLDADRLHPTKCRRAFAAGDLSLAVGIFASLAMIGGAILAALLLSLPFAFALLAYLVVTIAYSFGLKRIAFLDVSIVGTLFTLRLVMGTAVLDLVQSPWLLAFSLVFFFSMALAKRYGEVKGAARSGSPEIAGRGYQADDWPLVLAFGIASTLASIVVLLLFITSEAIESTAYSRPEWLYALPALVFAWQGRIWFFSHRMKLHDDPVVFALKDRVSLVLGAFVAIFTALAL
jgi:4-hydroxybenzoate polyprenyltransferase